ncbi:MAG TPA: RNase H family protein [Kofleriaceae bacterium]|jgi:ribonuclease HI|nr:RNase H family protein [Kofleriaceae bacterium]
MPWVRHRLRDADVWAKVDANAALLKDSNGRVEIVYKPATGAKVYRASARNLTPAPGSEPIEIEVGVPAEPRPPAAATPSRTSAHRATDVPENAIHVWTDGACSGNPGPAGLGVVVVGDGDGQREISEYLGEATNNIAELTAILRGLKAVPDKTRPVIVYSDSAYSIGLLTQHWKAKKNIELVHELREVCRQFSDLRFVKVLAHSGIALNERVDQLAVGAISRRGNSDRRV